MGKLVFERIQNENSAANFSMSRISVFGNTLVQIPNTLK